MIITFEHEYLETIPPLIPPQAGGDIFTFAYNIFGIYACDGKKQSSPSPLVEDPERSRTGWGGLGWGIFFAIRFPQALKHGVI